MENRDNILSNIKALISFDLILLFIKRVYQKSKENDIFIHAMGMVYITTLSIVPFLIFSFYIMTLFNFFGKIDTIVGEIRTLILNNLAAGTGESLIDYLELYILNVDIEQLGIISFLSLIFIIVFMLARVEMTFNRIWNVKEHRDLFKRFVSFWTFITLGTFSITLLLTLSLLFAERYLGLWLSGEQISQSSIFSYILFSFNFLFFIIAYYFVPNTDVKPKAALFAGLFSGFLFVLSKNIYSIYTANIITYNQIYGPLSIIPIFLLWLYLIWLIVLLGAVISYVFQHRSGLKYLLNRKKINQGLRDLIATAILLSLYKNYQVEGKPPLSFEELLEKINLPAEDIASEIDNLKQKNIIAETETGRYLPLNKAAKFTVWDSYQTNFLNEKFEIKNIFKEQEMQNLYKKIKEEEKNSFKKMKFIDFLN
ncbi:tRNA-processing RNAse BN [Halanaerobium saccharolyticum]|uniref:tRNA-processing RNAse BN n=1 Tax=Halanaerobium saccharolyticum TaxID=43595 RepID=A0A4R7YQC6_9FIRM|nr:YihY/virulence factor BrkB family protein [Halanaerobium saccharolyticum]RAK05354.1 tRNA-processing RNAse BN [Halanaerobium saccharolyticum]TDV99712.1 tRNA-processing RNAse BN [Halanaerobium saccharolyticum]TDX51869.1 tRNA-processing RNAse BN [Halanaerobium saccharolyticum]